MYFLAPIYSWRTRLHRPCNKLWFFFYIYELRNFISAAICDWCIIWECILIWNSISVYYLIFLVLFSHLAMFHFKASFLRLNKSYTSIPNYEIKIVIFFDNRWNFFDDYNLHSTEWWQWLNNCRVCQCLNAYMYCVPACNRKVYD